MKKFILIGVGSVGKRHLNVLKKLNIPTICIDKNSKLNRKFNNKNYPNILGFFKNISDARIKNLDEKESTTIIISTLGPTHLQFLEKLSSYGYKNFILEKPVATSISDIYKFKNLVKKRNLKVRLNLVFRYLNLKSEIDRIRKKYRLGSIKKMICYSGALDLSTCGSHILDLALQCLGGNPSGVVSNLYSEKINPRSKDLEFYEGTSIWKFENNIEFVLSMSNSSRIRGVMICVFENSYLVMHLNSTFNVYAIDGAITKKIYQHQPADKLIGSGKLFRDEFIPCDQIIKESIQNKKNSSNHNIAFHNANCIIGSIISSKLNKTIKLPVSSNNSLASKKFRIS